MVGGSALRVTTADIGPYAIELESVQIAQHLMLQFCVVSWGIPFNNGKPITTRINPFPTLEECRPVLRPVCETLLEILK